MKRLISILLIFTFAGAGLAHEGAMGIVKERMELMKSIGGSTKTLGQMVRGQSAYDAAAARAAAEAIAAKGGATMTALFPDGSLDPPTEALPAIWEDWPRFEALAADMTEKAEALAVTATGDDMPDTFRAAFQAMGETCGACHEPFRVKK